jgi:hypothetical protein
MWILKSTTLTHRSPPSKGPVVQDHTARWCHHRRQPSRPSQAPPHARIGARSNGDEAKLGRDPLPTMVTCGSQPTVCGGMRRRNYSYEPLTTRWCTKHQLVGCYTYWGNQGIWMDSISPRWRRRSLGAWRYVARCGVWLRWAIPQRQGYLQASGQCRNVPGGLVKLWGWSP